MAETSGCTYILAYFLIDQVNLMSTVHDNLSLFSTKVRLTNFNTTGTLTKHLYLDYSKWLNVNS